MYRLGKLVWTVGSVSGGNGLYAIFEGDVTLTLTIDLDVYSVILLSYLACDYSTRAVPLALNITTHYLS